MTLMISCLHFASLLGSRKLKFGTWADQIVIGECPSKAGHRSYCLRPAVTYFCSVAFCPTQPFYTTTAWIPWILTGRKVVSTLSHAHSMVADPIQGGVF